MAMQEQKTAAPGPAEKFNELSAIFGLRPLARLLHTRASHLQGYQSGELPLGARRTERLEALHAIVDSLKGSHNAYGINRWFNQPRHGLGHASPRYVLQSYPWRKKDGPVKRVSRMARDTVPPSGA